MQNRFVTLLLLCCSLLLLPLTTHASNMSSAGQRAIYQRLLEEPENMNLLYEYSQLAIKEGNFEAAIGALEGLLIVASNQPRVFLELGVLYQRLGVSKTADIYLRRARDLSKENSKIRNLANEYLIEINKQSSPHLFIGVMRVGVRYQENPTYSPEVTEIRSGGFNVPLPESRKAQHDVNALVFTRIEHRYNITDHTSFTSDLILYGTAYDDNSQLDLGVVEFSSGLKFESGRNADGQFSVRPHIVLRATSIDDNQFEQTMGAGIGFRSIFGANTALTTKYQFRDIEYKDFNDNDTASWRNGNEHRLNFRFNSEFMRGHLLEIGFFGRYKDAERDFLKVDQYDFSLRYSIKFNNFLFQQQRKMVLTPYAIRRLMNYGGADPEIDAEVTRLNNVEPMRLLRLERNIRLTNNKLKSRFDTYLDLILVLHNY